MAGVNRPPPSPKPDALGQAPSVMPEPRYSYELCGGTHLERTSDVGVFLIVSEGSAAAGVRRIEAVTGRGAYSMVRRRLDGLEGLATDLRTAPEEVPMKVDGLQSELATTRRQLAELRKQQAMTTFEEQLSHVEKVDGVTVLGMGLEQGDVDTLRALGDKFRERFPQKGVAVLAAGTVIIAVVTEDLVKRGLKAGDIISGMGGRGGGRPNMAQGSLPDASKLPEASSSISHIVRVRMK